MLRVTLLLVALCAGYLSAQKPVVNLDPEKIVQILPQVMSCLAETEVDIEVLNKLRSGEAGDDNDPKIPKFIYCAFTKSGVAKKNGRFNIDNTLNFYPSSVDTEAVKKALEECDKDGKDPVDTTFQITKCFYKTSPVKVMF